MEAKYLPDYYGCLVAFLGLGPVHRLNSLSTSARNEVTTYLPVRCYTAHIRKLLAEWRKKSDDMRRYWPRNYGALLDRDMREC